MIHALRVSHLEPPMCCDRTEKKPELKSNTEAEQERQYEKD